MERIAHEQERHALLVDNVLKRGEVFANIRPLQRLNSLRSEAERITNGESDAPFPEVEGEDSTGWPAAGIIHNLTSIRATNHMSMLE